MTRSAAGPEPREQHVPSPLDVLHLAEIFPVTLLHHFVARHEAQRSRIDAVTQAAAIARSVRENVAEMAIAMRRTHFRPDHAVVGVAQLIHVCRLDRLSETRPSAARLIFVRRSE